MNAKRMTLVRYAAVAAVSCLALARPAMAFESAEQEMMLRMENKFEHRNGESLNLPSHGTSSAYRICVKETTGLAIPLKVTVDGKDREVQNGVCEDVTGAHIAIAPRARLDKGAAPMGRFEPRK